MCLLGNVGKVRGKGREEVSAVRTNISQLVFFYDVVLITSGIPFLLLHHDVRFLLFFFDGRVYFVLVGPEL